MDRRQKVLLAIVLLGAGLVAILVVRPPLFLVDADEYEWTPVTVTDESGDSLGTVDARIANTTEKRRIGLSRTDSLDEDEGMLFVHDHDGGHTYHMPNMSFGIDIVFVAGNGTIREIHHAPKPEGDGTEDRYAGRGKYVLEVPFGWTNETGVEVGDYVMVPDEYADTDIRPGSTEGDPDERREMRTTAVERTGAS